MDIKQSKKIRISQFRRAGLRAEINTIWNDTVIINKAIKYTLFGSEYETYAGQKAIVNDDYDEENDELLCGIA